MYVENGSIMTVIWLLFILQFAPTPSFPDNELAGPVWWGPLYNMGALGEPKMLKLKEDCRPSA